MADMISELAGKAGISPEMAHKGVGAVLAYGKSKLSPDAYSRLISSVPGGEGMIAAAQPDAPGATPATGAAPAAAGGLGAIGGMIGKIFGAGGGGGGGSMAELAGMLGSAGFSMRQAEAFLPHALTTLKDKLPPE